MKKGFTLAEVLITLAIIGVVAALTIPSVIQNYKKIQTVTQLKKVYSALSNTTNLAILDHGPITSWEVGSWNGDASVAFADTYLIPYLKVSKNCGTEISANCGMEAYKLNGAPYIFDRNFARFYLTDGTLIALITINGEYKYAVIYVDINGKKKPNTFGKDIFVFVYNIKYVVDGKFVPPGYLMHKDLLTLDSYDDACNKNKSGWYCASLIMKDGWKMPDNYPW